MAELAIIKNGVVVNRIVGEPGFLGAVECEPHVGIGWAHDGAAFIAPPPPPAPPPPDWSAIDQDALNRMLAAKGSVTRALAILLFKEINKLRVKGGDAAYTMEQFKAALAAEQART